MKHQKDQIVGMGRVWLIYEMAQKLGYTYMAALFLKKDLSGMTLGKYRQILRTMVNADDPAYAYKLLSRFPDKKDEG
jgi:hypothetical protein